MTTFGSQLNGMGGRVREIGLYLNSGRFIVVGLAVPITTLLLFSEDILLALGQDEALSYQASQFLKGLSPSVVIFGFSCLHEQFLMSQRKIAPGLISNFMACVLQFTLNIFFIWKWDLGMWGAGMSVTVTNTIQSCFFVFLLWFYEDIRQMQFLPSFNKEQWTYIKTYLHLGIPSMLMAFLEIGGVEVFQPLSGLISTSSNGAQSIVMNVYACMFTLYMGASIAAGILVG
jgi:multidrug resistance protein, MATE family